MIVDVTLRFYLVKKANQIERLPDALLCLRTRMLNYLSKVIHICHFLLKIMTIIYDNSACIDVHIRFIIGTILTFNGNKDQRRFECTIAGIQSLHD